MSTDDDIFDEPSAPNCDEHDGDPPHLACLFQQAATNSELAWVLSTALCTLQSFALRRPRDGSPKRALRPQQRLDLLSSIEAAYRTAWSELPAGFEREQIASGMRAAAELVEFWAAPRVLTMDDKISDAIDVARSFRNLLHNESLRLGMAGRSARRMQNQAAATELFGTPAPKSSPPPIAFLGAQARN